MSAWLISAFDRERWKEMLVAIVCIGALAAALMLSVAILLSSANGVTEGFAAVFGRSSAYAAVFSFAACASTLYLREDNVMRRGVLHPGFVLTVIGFALLSANAVAAAPGPVPYMLIVPGGAMLWSAAMAAAQSNATQARDG